jgi:CheY-like chemotaxis protein/Tfp pilus assembly protein PilZ
MTQGQSIESSSSVSKSAAAFNNSKKKILLVDDVKLILELEKTFFQRKNSFEVLTAGNGEEALKIVEAEQPDLIYMDLHMPEMNGDECCRLIKASEGGKNIPVVMVMSAGNEEDRNCCLAAGCDEIITKPVNRSLFLSVAKKYIEVHERKEPRYASHIKIRFGQHLDELLTDYTVNINIGGLFLSSPRLLPVDTLLFVELSLPENGKAVCCQGRVAWVNEADSPLKLDLPVGMGLEFDDIAPDDMNVIREYIKKNALAADW